MSRIVRRSLVLVASAVMAAGMSIGVAQGASAATYTLAPCQIGDFTVLDGDTVRFVYGPGDSCGGNVQSPSFYDTFALGSYQCETWGIGPGTSIHIVGTGAALNITVGPTSTLGLATPASWSVCGGDPVEEAAGEPIRVVQAVPVPGSGTCDDVDDSALGYGTKLSGGWSRSWQQWATHGSGGAVCQRTLVNDGEWRIQA
jgi:hypothetical protein